jgi:hypothetical protein
VTLSRPLKFQLPADASLMKGGPVRGEFVVPGCNPPTFNRQVRYGLDIGHIADMAKPARMI